MKKAFIVAGAPAAGKSTYGAKLAKERGAGFLDIDTVTGRMAATALKEKGMDPYDRDSAYFKAAYRKPIYDTLFEIARENLAWIDVVIVGPFTKELSDATWPEKLAALLGAEVEVHYVHCAPEIRKRRIELRGHSRDRAKLENWEQFLSYYGAEERPAFKYVSIDTSK